MTHHIGETVVLPVGPYELDDPMIVTRGRTETELQVELVKLAKTVQEEVHSDRYPLTEEDLAVVAWFESKPTAYANRELRAAALKLRAMAGVATVFVTEWVAGLSLGLEFKKVGDGYFAIVPDHPCSGKKTCLFDTGVMAAQAARILIEGGLPEHVRDEYGKCIQTGFRIDHGAGPFQRPGQGTGARIEHKIPNEDLMNPDRRSSDERWLEKYRYAAVYTYALEQAGWLAELRVTPTNNVIVLARPKENGE